MDAAAAVRMLDDTARLAGVGPIGLSRMADIQELLGAEMRWVEAGLSQAARDGLLPATDAATHLLRAGGKRVRPLCVLLATMASGPVSDSARELAICAEMVHLATLLHDDVVDDGDERRGEIAARRVYGNAVSVLAGDLLLVHALSRTAAVGRDDVLSELLSTLRQLVLGEVVQLRGRTRLDLTEETYLKILEGKTASLFRWALRSGARVGGACDAIVERFGIFGERLGMSFQLVDDALDYAGDPRELGKGLFADLREGKVTLPLIFAARDNPSLHEAFERAREGDELARTEIVRAAAGACGAVRARARAESEAAVAALAPVPDSRAKRLLVGVARELPARLT